MSAVASLRQQVAKRKTGWNAVGVSPRCWYTRRAPVFYSEVEGENRPFMERPTTTKLRIGDWGVNPASGEISRNGETSRLEVRTMRVLVSLAEHAGEVVSIDDLLNQVWPDVTVAPDSVYQAVTSLRRLLGDDPKQPTYIATIPRLGYRMVATVSPWSNEPIIQTGAKTNAPDMQKKSGPGLRAGYLWAVCAALFLALVVALLLYGSLAK